jgi:hypothetical protein
MAWQFGNPIQPVIWSAPLQVVSVEEREDGSLFIREDERHSGWAVIGPKPCRTLDLETGRAIPSRCRVTKRVAVELRESERDGWLVRPGLALRHLTMGFFAAAAPDGWPEERVFLFQGLGRARRFLHIPERDWVVVAMDTAHDSGTLVCIDLGAIPELPIP